MKNSKYSTRIIIEKRIGAKYCFLLILLLAIFEYILLKIIFASLIVLVFYMPQILNDYAKRKEYLSEILIYDDYIQLVYKCKDVVINTKNIKKENIKNFHVETYIPEGRTYYNNPTSMYAPGFKTSLYTEIIIDVLDETPIIYQRSDDMSTLVGGWQTVINLVKEHEKIPNFSYEVKGDCVYAKAQIEKYYTQKIDLNVLEYLNVFYITNKKSGNFCTIGWIFVILFCVGFIVYIFCI